MSRGRGRVRPQGKWKCRALSTAAGDFDPDYFRRDPGGKGRNRSKKRRRNGSGGAGSGGVERPGEGCFALEWHTYHFPNCNEIHEIDLGVRQNRILTLRAISIP